MKIAEVFKRRILARKKEFLSGYDLSVENDGIDSCFSFLYTAGAVSDDEMEIARILEEF